MKIREKIKKQYKTQRFSRITRKVAVDWHRISRGYIVDYSDHFIVLQETEDFKLLGFSILPVKDIKKIRFSDHDKYYDKIMFWEGEKPKIALKTKVDLSSWKSVFKTFQKKKKDIIVECENPEIGSFTIGLVNKVSNKDVSVFYFDAAGFVDKKPTKVKFKHITKVMFDDRYIDVFSKYKRKKKSKK